MTFPSFGRVLGGMLAISSALFGLVSATLEAAPASNDSLILARGGTYNNVRATYYDVTVGPTFCGQRFSNSDFIVALSVQLIGPGWPSPQCGRKIRITGYGKSAIATVQDECEICGSHMVGAFDLTPGLFSHFQPLGQGVITLSWEFLDGSGGGGGGGGDGGGNTGEAKAKPSTTKKPPPPTSTAHKTTSTSSSSSDSSSDGASKTTDPAPAATTPPANNMQIVYPAMNGLNVLLAAAVGH